MMIENTTLKGLNLSHNEFTDKGGVLLAQGIGKCSLAEPQSMMMMFIDIENLSLSKQNFIIHQIMIIDDHWTSYNSLFVFLDS